MVVRLLDVLLLMILGWGGYRGYRKGLVLELCSMGALVLAALGSTKLLDGAVGFFAKWYHDPKSELLPYVAFVLLFIIILIATMLLSRLLKVLIKPTLLGNLDGPLGSIVGILKWGLGSSACLWIGSLVQLKIPEIYTANTLLYPIIESLAPQLLAWCITWFPLAEAWLPTNEPISQ